MLSRVVLLLVAAVASGLSTPAKKAAVPRKAALAALVASPALLFFAAAPPALALNPMVDTKKRRPNSALPDQQQAYLTEPTEEFKKEEAERAAFRKRQAEYRAKWDDVFGSFQQAKDDAGLATALSGLSKLVQVNGGLPYGLRLTDMITLCRRVKAKALQTGGWDTPVELEYMTLVRTVKRAQNPNLTTEDTGFL